ncbi:histidinol dehydrogenase [Helicobacter sp. faydin-H76]|uniref:Histidinol dehydrogenase n=1 Tax=Helicobacter cappadocius TaxID=3063998 RepID=A0AA90TC65_9HELI|nr:MULTISPECIES: histidinol dehydrogenase [unclassified Helicobacter]MDO7253583.1 histidinol dehydrogenase [Helicobacter sp. faydin-H75]MDP2539511.1 histidinol dehydrogenase [Helicobacter sp. faydin-H76]
MIKIFNTSDSNFSATFMEILNRGKMDIKNVTPIVQNLLDDVIFRGIDALKENIFKFDKWEPRGLDDIRIPLNDLAKAYNQLDDNAKSALHTAYDRIYSFHLKQKPKTWLDFEENGTVLGQKITPVDRAGLYIPGGKAVYPSSLLMNAIPAIVAGVKDIIVCTPTPSNEPNNILLATAYLCGIKEIYKVGGASAIGLMAYGIDGVKKVDVITGPGNIFVATAKKLVFGEVCIDMIAGPSEIGIIADENANPKYIAHDLLSQSEHDEMASSILITTSKELATEVSAHVSMILPSLSRKNIAKESISNRGAIIVAKDIDECIALSNQLAFEHLEILTHNSFELLSRIKHAGAIFLGENTPEPIGDYLAGPNHTLPTGGSAKFFSPLGTEVFMKKSSIISFSKQALDELGEECAILADLEGLDAHKKAILVRKKEI